MRQREDAAIFRLTQVVGAGGNPCTLTNFIYNKIKDGQPFEAWAQAERNLVDVEHVARIVSNLIEQSGGGYDR